jgi:hypothetical protein
MTAPKPKMDWMRLWPIGLAIGGFIAGYSTLQSQVSHNTQQTIEIKRSLERDLESHERIAAHGSVERELGELKIEIKNLQIRLGSLESRLFRSQVQP